MPDLAPAIIFSRLFPLACYLSIEPLHLCQLDVTVEINILVYYLSDVFCCGTYLLRALHVL